MFRNRYDSDASVWSPQGRLHQVEYAMEAVKLGSTIVGLKNQTHAVVIALKRAESELAAYQKKIQIIDSHVGMAFAGLTADATLLCRFMRTECMHQKYSEDEPLPVTRLVTLLETKMQLATQRYDKRPYGVGLLIAAYDDRGPHIYQTSPSANCFDCKAMAIGEHSQPARTYLEKHYEDFAKGETDELIKYGLRALIKSLTKEVEPTTNNISIGMVGKEMKFTIFDQDAISVYLSAIKGVEKIQESNNKLENKDENKPAEPSEPDANKPADVGPSEPDANKPADVGPSEPDANKPADPGPSEPDTNVDAE